MSRWLLACALLPLAATLARAQDCPDLSLVVPIGTGTAGSAGVPQLVLIGQAGVDEPWPALRVEHGPPHGLGQIAVGAPGVVVPLPQYGASLYVGGAFTRWVVPLDAEGRSAPLGGGDGPVPASFCGLEFAAQGLTIDAGATGGCAFSAGLTLRFGAGSGATSLFEGMLMPELTIGIVGLSSAMEVGDLDGNGLLDIAFPTNGINGRIDVFLQLADGGFVKRHSAGLGFFIRDLALGDLDGDGLLDAVVLGGNTGRTIGAEFGQPDGSLSPLAVLATGTDTSPPTALALADMDGDGRLDAVTLDWVVGSVGVHLGGPGGALGAPLLQALGMAVDPESFTIADIDEDGHLDVLLLAGSPADRVAILYGLGGGALAPPDSAPAGASPASGLAIADAVGDSRPDLLVTIEGGSLFAADPASLRALENLGTGFAPAIVLHDELNPLSSYHGVVLADLDEDGTVDALVPGLAEFGGGPIPPEPTLNVLSSLGAAGSWTSVKNPVGDSTRFRTADVNADGHVDVVHDAVAFGPGSAVLVQHGRGDGTLEWPTPSPELGIQPSVVGDFDEDGRADIAMEYPAGPGVRIGLGTAEATLLPGATIATSGFPRTVAVADLDGDGHLDLAVTMDSKSLAVILGNGDGSFAPAIDLVPPAGADFGGNFVAAADVTGDGILDLVTMISVAPPSAMPVHVLAGLGAGNFAPPVTTMFDPGLGGATLADLDGDGRADIVFSGKSDGDLRVVLATGAGAFGTPVLVSAAYGAIHPGPPVGDVDGDGDLDVVFHDPDPNHARIGLNDGAAHFTLLPAFEYFPNTGLRLADVNGDGRLDLLGGGVGPGYGDGSFAPQDLGYVDGAAADIDGDGDLDATDFGIVWENRPH
jgi:hypothetical protein